MARIIEKRKTLIYILNASDYCEYMRVFYGLGYTIHHSATHPRSITIPSDILGYIERRDVSGDTYKFVIYGKIHRPYNNARVVYLTRQTKGE